MLPTSFCLRVTAIWLCLGAGAIHAQQSANTSNDSRIIAGR
jgi:hypothetical protein